MNLTWQPRAVLRPRLLERLRLRLGGPARTRVVVLFACVLGLNTADLASIGAVAGQLKPALGLTNTQLGLLAAGPSLAAAVGTLPMGVLADRVRRVPVLTVCVAVWAVAMLLSGMAQSYGQLLGVRLFLGAASAAAYPLVASLVGDLFPAGERGTVYGYILAGELLGTGFGLLVSGNIAQVSWRAAFWVLALPSVGVALALWRLLPEPARGGASKLWPGAEEVPAVEEVAAVDADADAPPTPDRDPEVERAVRRARVAPVEPLVLRHDPQHMSLLEAIRYVLRVRTNVILIMSSALGYFFQAGINTFGVVFIISHFGLTQSGATSLLALIATAALAGTVLGGRIADRLLGRGHLAARMLVAGVAFIAASLLFAPGLMTRTLLVAVPLFFVATAALGAPNAPLDAARLDIIPARLWGRAEAIRNVLQMLSIAAAPLVFGAVSDAFSNAARASTKTFGYHASAHGLEYTFLLMLVPMAVSGIVLLQGVHAYRRDVATAIASDDHIARAAPP